MNRALARLLKRSAGIGSEEALSRVLAAAEAAGPAPGADPELATLLSRLREFLDRVGATFDQYDRDLDLRTRSLELTSEELVGANERLLADLATRNRVLEALRDAAGTLLGAGGEAAAFPATSDVEGLSALLPVLVRQQEANRAALAESERKFSNLYQNTPVMLHASDEAGVLTSVNDYWLSLLGYARDEVVGSNLARYATETSRRHLVDVVLPQLRRSGLCRNVSLELVAKDGRTMDVVLYAYSEPAADGAGYACFAAMLDVSETRRAERLRAALHEISDAAHSTADLPEMFRAIHHIVGTLLPAPNFFVALYDDAGGWLSFPYFVDEHDPPPPPRRLGEGGLTEEVLRTGAALLVTPPAMEARVRRGEAVFGTDSLDWLGVPLRTRSQTIGVLGVQSYSGNVRYSEDDKSLLQFVSSQVAAAIERKRAETDLKQSQERLQRALEASRLALWDYDLANGTIYVSEAWSEVFGGPGSPAVTAPARLLALVPPEDRRAMRSALLPLLRGRLAHYRVEHRVVAPDGRTHWFLSQGHVTERGPDGRARRATGTSLDITERKRSEEALQIAALVYQHSSEAMMVCDDGNRVIAINPAFTALTGYAAEDVIGRTPAMLASGLHGKDFFRDMWERLKSTGGWQGEVWNRHKDGRVYAEALAINTIRRPDGRLHRYVALFSDITEQKEAERLIWQQANFDALTQLPNRRMFRDRLEVELKKSHRDGSALAVLFVDLDRFKEVNDTLGHEMGDQLLVEATRRIRDCVRDTEMISRFGGDEFTIALAGLRDAGSVDGIAQRIVDVLVAPFALGCENVFISASVGIALYPRDATSIDDLFKHADQALYSAKAAGRGRFSYFTRELQVAAQERMRLTNDLHAALAESQFSLEFQPLVELATGRVRKAEALLRWRHPQRGLVDPAQFIPLAEANGLIGAIGGWVFREATAWIKRWRDAGNLDFQVSINQSPREFQRQGGSYADWLAYLRRIGLPGSCISVEITEGLLLDASAEVKAMLRELHDAGIEVAIDDFGVGHSSLSYLKDLHIDYLKIDRSFTRNLAPGSSDLVVSEAIIAMAHKLGIRVVAEGVETEAQRSLLQAAGCDYAQGYLLAAPMPAEAFEQYLAARAQAAA